MFSINPEKIPGPDGFSAMFYPKFWGVIGKEVVSYVQDFFRNTKVNPTDIRDYRPISLCSTSYKLSKTLVFRLQQIIPKLFSKNQGAFVRGHRATDNIIIAKELFHIMANKTRKTKMMAIKLDVEKARDLILF